MPVGKVNCPVAWSGVPQSRIKYEGGVGSGYGEGGGGVAVGTGVPGTPETKPRSSIQKTGWGSPVLSHIRTPVIVLIAPPSAEGGIVTFVQPPPALAP